jgi:hypothetical protein
LKSMMPATSLSAVSGGVGGPSVMPRRINC